jgi:non-specific serine/threonine protein kinase
MVSNASETVDRSNSSSSAAPLAAGTQLQEFVIERLVGIGGFGIVYLAQDTLLHRRVAIKEYMPTATAARFDGVTVSVRSQSHLEEFEMGKRSFINEARMLARFKHPSLLEVFRFWEQHGTAYMAMPYYEGITLKETVKLNGAIKSEEKLKSIINPLLDALDYMHQDSVYHRDIAPDNIMLLANGRPVLLDLGAARTVATEGGHALTVLVKPGYAPVEQYADDASVRQGPWTDIYALGAVSWFAIMGVAPPPSASRMLRDGMAPLSGSGTQNFSSECLEGIDIAMRIRPEDRPQTINALRTSLGWDRGGAQSEPRFGIETSKQTVKEPASKASVAAPAPIAAKPIPVAAPLPTPIVNAPIPVTVAAEKIIPVAISEKPKAAEVAPEPEKIKAPEVKPVVYEDVAATVVVAKKEPLKAAAQKIDASKVEALKVETPKVAVKAPVAAAVSPKPAKSKGNKSLAILGIAGLAIAGIVFAIVNRSPSEKPPEVAAIPAVQTPTVNPADTPAVVTNPPVASSTEPSVPPQIPAADAVKDNKPTEPIAVKPLEVSTPPVSPPAAVAVDPPKPEEPKVVAPTIDPSAPAVVRLNIKPWGEVFVNGKSRLVSPPDKVLSLPPGDYTIEIKNTENPTASFKAKLGPGDQFRLGHDFTSGKSTSGIIKASPVGASKPKSAVATPPKPTTESPGTARAADPYK